MSILAHYWPNKHFIVLENNVDMINALNGFNNTNQRIMFFHKPDLDHYVTRGINTGNLHFSFNIDHELGQSQIIFIAVDLPLKIKPKVIKYDLNLKDFEDAIKCVLQYV